jgi:hypothetical protein
MNTYTITVRMTETTRFKTTIEAETEDDAREVAQEAIDTDMLATTWDYDDSEATAEVEDIEPRDSEN